MIHPGLEDGIIVRNARTYDGIHKDVVLFQALCGGLNMDQDVNSK